MNNLRISALTDVGKAREHNEDNFIVCPDLYKKEWFLIDKPFQSSSVGTLLVVADGMGGANAGEVASEIAVDTIKRFFSSQNFEHTPSEKQMKELVKESIIVAHKAIVLHADAHPECEGMGTTIVLAWVLSDKVIFAWCGDSRGYLYNVKEGVKIITKDHSLVWELVEAGRLTPQEADVHPDSNIITQSLGDPNHAPEPDVIVETLRQSDKIMLCSDGLNNMVDINEINQLLGANKDLQEINRDLIKAANQNGGKDNITVVLLEILQQDIIAGAIKEKNTTKISLFFLGLIVLLVFSAAFWLLNRKPPVRNSAVMKEKKSEVVNITSFTDSNNVNESETKIKVIDKGTVHSLYKDKSVVKDNSAQRDKEKSKSNIIPKSNERDSILTDSTLILSNEHIKKTEQLLHRWDDLEERINKEKAKNTIHNTDTESNPGAWISIHEGQKELNEIIKKNNLKNIIGIRRNNNENFPQMDINEFNTQFNKAEEVYEEIRRNFEVIMNKINTTNN